MLVHKAFKFRAYPTAAQVARLEAWEGALRFLWNLAHEQRLMGLARPKGERVYPTAFDQINELTALRAELPWLAALPRNVCAQLLIELDRAWQRCVQRLTRTPRWKRKGKDFLSLTEPHPRYWRLEGPTLRFPKLGNLRAVLHRPLEGKPKTCTLKRDGDQWFAIIDCEVEVNPEPRTAPVVAIDRGITNFLADSDGHITANSRYLEQSLARLRRAQRTLSRRKKGSRRREKAKKRVMRLHRKVRRQREHFLHVQSARYAKSHGIIVLEKLNVQGMIRSNLSRQIAYVGWSKFEQFLRYKLEWSGGHLIEVPPQYSSQTCAACGHVDARSRRRERFCCTSCGHIAHADLNAALVLKSRANRSALPVDGSLPLGPGRSGKVKTKLRVPRRHSSQSSIQ